MGLRSPSQSQRWRIVVAAAAACGRRAFFECPSLIQRPQSIGKGLGLDGVVQRWCQCQCQCQARGMAGATTTSTTTAASTGTSTLRIFIVAGEPSGDAIGSRLMASLRCLSPSPVEFAGVGGPLMEKQGMTSQFEMGDISVMGVAELIPHAFRIWARLRETVAAAVKFQPKVVITVDAKGFSFRVLDGIGKAYAQLGQNRPRTVHYVSPSFWAWKGGEEKLNNLAKIVDHMLCILPFEDAVCRANGLAATFVGHPVLDDAHSVASNDKFDHETNWHIKGDGAYFRRHHKINPEATVLSVLPGSRSQEVQRMLPIFEGAIHPLTQSIPDLTVVIPTVQSRAAVDQIVDAAVRKWKLPVVVLSGASETDKYSAFAASSAALCTSGTAVMQLLMARVPCVVAYRAHLLTEWIIRFRTKLQFISLPNILLNRRVIPEALFGACTASELHHHLRQLLDDKALQQKQAVEAGRILNMLAPPLREEIRAYFGTTENRDCRPTPSPSIAAAYTVLQVLEKPVKTIRN